MNDAEKAWQDFSTKWEGKMSSNPEDIFIDAFNRGHIIATESAQKVIESMSATHQYNLDVIEKLQAEIAELRDQYHEAEENLFNEEVRHGRTCMELNTSRQTITDLTAENERLRELLARAYHNYLRRGSSLFDEIEQALKESE